MNPGVASDGRKYDDGELNDSVTLLGQGVCTSDWLTRSMCDVPPRPRVYEVDGVFAWVKPKY